MSNIWEVFLQSATVTLCAWLLLIVKNVLRDKLSPRWQYGVWWALALRILWPASMSRTLLFNFPLWFEMLKTRFESGGSAYAGKYVPLKLHSGLPWISSEPQSFTDWLFIIYIVGIFAFLLRRAWGHMRLRRMLRLGGEPTAQLREAMERVCTRYELKPCRVVTVPQLPTAFVCGIFRPILAVPEGDAPDDKVLLHELLHLKHRDVLQNVLWCCLRALHWWNFFLIPVFERIENELESLCDQRVLERLEGEERRDYGGILLCMASEKYARTTGTSSISNGGEFISERIENIARFKKYPRGMALVSTCIVFVLALGMLGGAVKDYHGTGFTDSAYVTSSGSIDRSMAVTRVARCRTPDAAIDAYAKAMIHRNGYYLATASPMERQEAIIAEMEASVKPNVANVFIDVGAELEFIDYIGGSGYIVSEYTANSDGSVDAEVQLAVSTLMDSEGQEIVYEYVRDGNTFTDYGGIVAMSLRAEKTTDGWIAYESAPRRCLTKNQLMDFPMLYMEPSFSKTVVTEHGTVTMEGLVCRGMTEFKTFSFFGSYDNTLHLNESFKDSLVMMLEYELWERSTEGFNPQDIRPEDWPGSSVSVEIDTLWSEREPKFMFDGAMDAFHGTKTKSQHHSYVYTSWSTSLTKDYLMSPDPSQIALADAPWGYAVRICWDDEVVEEIVFPLEEVMACG